MAPLAPGQTRKLVSMRVPGEAEPRNRSVVVNADGSMYYEVGLRLVNGVRDAPVLHLSADMGP
eukprot:3237903-Pyramimonas_sp.AAC.1